MKFTHSSEKSIMSSNSPERSLRLPAIHPAIRGLAAVLFFVIAVSAPPAVGAEPRLEGEAGPMNAEGEQDETWSERIVVTATRAEQTAENVPLHATVISQEEIVNAPDDGIADLLRTIPSFNWQGDANLLASTPTDGGITFRGLGGQARGRALMMVDGIPINEPFGTWVNMARIPRGTVERVEILPGGTGIWGNFSMTGTINLITRAPTSNSLNGELRVGNKSTVLGNLGYSDRGQLWSGSLVGDVLDTDGYHKFAVDQRGPIIVPISKEALLFSGKLHRTVGDRGLFRVSGTSFSEDMVDSTPLTQKENNDDSFAANFDWATEDAGRWDLRIYLRETGFYEQDPSVEDGNTAETLNSRTDVPTDALGVGAVWSSRGAGRHALGIGFDYQEVEIDADAQQNFNGSFFEDRGSIQGTQRFAGLFVQDVFDPSDRTSITLGGRFDRVRIQDGFRRQVDQVTGEITDTVLVDQVTKEVFTPSLGLVHQLTDSSRLRASIYGGFRAAAPGEMFVDNLGRNINKSNPNLEPEEMLGAEVGLDLSTGSVSSTRATVYVNETDNLIDRLNLGRAGPGGEVLGGCGFVPEGVRCRFRENLDTVRVIGLELDQRFTLAEHWRVWLSGTLLDTDVRESLVDPNLVGNSVRRTPDEVATVRLDYSNPEILSGQLRVRYVGERFDDAVNETLLESQTYVDLSFSRNLGENWRLFAGITNLFDERNVINPDTDADELSPPRLYRVGVRFRID